MIRVRLGSCLFFVLLSVLGVRAERMGAAEDGGGKAFVHPGVVVTTESGARMKDYIARQA